MAFDVQPSVGDSELAAIRAAFERVGLPLDTRPAAYTSNWRRAALEEAFDDEPEPVRPEPVRYAPSPRRTRGATRA